MLGTDSVEILLEFVKGSKRPMAQFHSVLIFTLSVFLPHCCYLAGGITAVLMVSAAVILNCLL